MITYMLSIEGCHDCPSAFIHDEFKTKDRCLYNGTKNRRIGKYVEKKTVPKWCLLLKNPMNYKDE